MDDLDFCVHWARKTTIVPGNYVISHIRKVTRWVSSLRHTRRIFLFTTPTAGTYPCEVRSLQSSTCSHSQCIADLVNIYHYAPQFVNDSVKPIWIEECSEIFLIGSVAIKTFGADIYGIEVWGLLVHDS
jgi:hypothetical protein